MYVFRPLFLASQDSFLSKQEVDISKISGVNSQLKNVN